MLITSSTKMAEIIHSNYLLLPIFNRFDIQLGFGDKTVEQICTDKNVNIDFFLEIVNSFNDKNYFPQTHLQSFPLKLIIDYIKKSHDYYLDFKVPQIESLIKKLVTESSEETKKKMVLIEQFFHGYREELIAHISKEDNEVHPYVLTIDKAFFNKSWGENHKKLIRENSISLYENDHDDVEEKLDDLKNIIIKYLPPIKDYTLTNSLLIEIFRLENDLNDHARIEDKVLVPKVKAIEKEILGED